MKKRKKKSIHKKCKWSAIWLAFIHYYKLAGQEQWREKMRIARVFVWRRKKKVKSKRIERSLAWLCRYSIRAKQRTFSASFEFHQFGRSKRRSRQSSIVAHKIDRKLTVDIFFFNESHLNWIKITSAFTHTIRRMEISLLLAEIEGEIDPIALPANEPYPRLIPTYVALTFSCIRLVSCQMGIEVTITTTIPNNSICIQTLIYFNYKINFVQFSLFFFAEHNEEWTCRNSNLQSNGISNARSASIN